MELGCEEISMDLQRVSSNILEGPLLVERSSAAGA